MQSALLKLNLKDLSKGLVVAVMVVVLGAVQESMKTDGLSFAQYDWGGMLDLAWKAAGAYLMKNLMSDESGKVLGKIG